MKCQGIVSFPSSDAEPKLSPFPVEIVPVEPLPVEPSTKPEEQVSLLEGATDLTITGGSFNAAGRDVNITTTTTVNNIIINFLDGKPLSDADILEWLSAINYRAIQMDNFEKVAPGTGQWFLQSEIFLRWLMSQEGILWGTGMRTCHSTDSLNTTLIA
jgi:hypothetical protein